MSCPYSNGTVAPLGVTSPHSFHSRSTTLLIHASLILYSFFHWLQTPIVPYLSKEVGATPLVQGYIQSFGQLLMFAGAPLVGRLIDLYGAKSALLLSHAVVALSSLSLSQATTVTELFLSQIPTVFMGAMQTSQALTTYLSTTDDRAKSLGRLSFSYALGFIFGPILGGILSKYLTYQHIALLSGAGSAFTCLTLYFFLPHIPVPVKQHAHTSSPSNNFTKIIHLLRTPSIRYLMCIKLCMAVALSTYRSYFTLYTQQAGLTASQHGYILSSVGCLMMLVNTFGVSYLTARFSEYTIMRTGIVLITVSFLGICAQNTIPVMLFFLVLTTIAGVAMHTVGTSLLTKSAAISDAGTVLGLDMGTGTAGRVVAPTLAGYMLSMAPVSSPLFSATLSALSWLFAAWCWQARDSEAQNEQKQVKESKAE